jgi:hypothetical protein
VTDDAIARALADIRSIPPADEAQDAAPEPSACCEGDHAAYQRHIWHKETPCEASRAANRAYGAAWRAANREKFRAYQRAYRARLRGAKDGDPGA